jgi:hypothetical protein
MYQANLEIYLKIITRNEENGPEIRPNADQRKITVGNLT